MADKRPYDMYVLYSLVIDRPFFRKPPDLFAQEIYDPALLRLSFGRYPVSLKLMNNKMFVIRFMSVMMLMVIREMTMMRIMAVRLLLMMKVTQMMMQLTMC